MIFILYSHFNFKITDASKVLTKCGECVITRNKFDDEFNINNNVECGGANTIFKNRIIGGVDTSPHEYPWVAAIFDDDNEIYCGGSIISNQHILSAGHCVY